MAPTNRLQQFRSALKLLSLHKGARKLARLEAAGFRTAAATVAPLIWGQVTNHVVIGLMIGIGALNVCSADKKGATVGTMLITTFGAALAFWLGTLAGNTPLLAVGLMFFYAFAGGMLGVYGEIAGQVGFVVALVFATALGIPGSFAAANERLLEAGFGGLLATMLTVALWKWELKTVPWLSRRTFVKSAYRVRRAQTWARKAKWNLTLRSEVFQHALRLASISALSVALYKTLPIQHGLWLTLTVLIVVKPVYTDTRKRAAERVFGTLIGGALAFILAATIRNTIAVDIVMLLLCAVAYSHQQTDYGLYVVFLTPFVLLLLHIAEPGSPPLTLTRMFDTLIGGAIALALAYLMRPRGHKSRVEG